MKGLGAHEERALGGRSPPNTPLAEEGRACGRVSALERSSGPIGRAMRRVAAAAARADVVAMVPGWGAAEGGSVLGWVARGLGESMGCGSLGRGGIQKGMRFDVLERPASGQETHLQRGMMCSGTPVEHWQAPPHAHAHTGTPSRSPLTGTLTIRRMAIRKPTHLI